MRSRPVPSLARRGLPASFVAVAMAAAALTWTPMPATAAAEPTAKASPAAAKPGRPVQVTGKAPECGAMPYQVRRLYTDDHAARVEDHVPMGGVAAPDGSFTVNLTVPAGATRSNIFRPYGEWQYFTVVVEFPSCDAGLVATNIEVLSFRKDQHITLSTNKPRTGTTLRVEATHCVGGVLDEFAWVIDRAGSYFMMEGETTGTTYRGSVDLRRGFRGDEQPTGRAVPSRKGQKDSVVAVPCLQSEGPASVAKADKIFHQSCVLNITIRPAQGQKAPPPKKKASNKYRAFPTSSPSVSEAPVARPFTGTPTYTG